MHYSIEKSKYKYRNKIPCIFYVKGTVYYNKVYAVDNVGYISDITVSDGVTIDVTPPQPEYLYHSEDNVLKNPSFETYKSSLSIETIDLQNICNLSTDFIPKFWFLSTGSCATILTSNRNLARDGRSFLFIIGSVKQEIRGLQLGGLYRVDFFSSQLTRSEALVSNREGFVSFGKFNHILLMYSKAYRHDEREMDLSRETVSWQRHTFYFSAKESILDFEIVAIRANMGIYLDHISIRHVEKMSNNSVTTHVSAHVVYIHQWGSIHAAWSFIEDFSPITEYNWAKGILFIFMEYKFR